MVTRRFDPVFDDAAERNLGQITNYNLNPHTTKHYLSLATGHRIPVAEAERLGRTLEWPYFDPERPELQRRVVLGANLVAYRKRPYHHFFLETYDSTPLPQELADLGVFSTLDELLRALAPFHLNLTIQQDE